MQHPCRLLIALFLATAAPLIAKSQEDSSDGIGCGYSWQQSICKLAPADFSFNDGCNTVTCDGSGSLVSTLMACPPAATAEERQRCQTIRENIQLRLDDADRVTCPALSMQAVCATAGAGFTYSDGCNPVVCDGNGSGTSTLMFCPSPGDPTQIARCERRMERLVERMEPRTCSGINKTEVCRMEGIGYRFSDGCNTIECGESGMWTSTLMGCPPASSESALCQWVVSKARRTAPEGNQDLDCPELAMSRICTNEMNGFRYNDGCNEVHCSSPGRGVSTTRLCRVGSEAEAARRCSDAKTAMEAKRRESKRRTSCLTAADVCKQPGERKSFFDGCNYCFCMGVNRAGCTRRACQPYFSTEEEFRAECVRRKAGIIN
ncbi:hypothetical protein BOX15_Mlig003398g2 [Macrostomum lignano]|uniref:Pacifastin domain-containing protein n=1 Tax=Macrostomum lignano TaxID=282301 RepID=A0A267GPX3_9PLAT|nr:hypothetical protein BOX15_Mlig003398g2 [Macrostomum lignano]